MKNLHSNVKVKVLALFLALITLLSLTTTASVYAENAKDETKEEETVSYSFTENGIEYLITGENTVTVTGFDRTAFEGDKVTLNKVTHDGKEYNVTKIASMKGLYTEEFTVVIGEKVTAIGKEAFKNCAKTTVEFSEAKNVKTVGNEAFKGVKSVVNSVDSFEGLTMVGKDAFDFEGDFLPTADKDGFVLLAGGKLLYKYEGEKTEIKLPATVTTICGGAFEGNTKITSVNLNNVTVIGENAFNGCSALEAVTVTDALTAVGRNALKGTPYFEALTSNDGFCRMSENKEAAGYKVLVKYTGKAAVVNVPEDVVYIGSAFEGNTTITKVVIPASVEVICDGAFSSCTKLQEVSMTNNTREGASLVIGSLAFEGTLIKSVFIPTHVTEIASDAFADCENLTEIQVSNQSNWLKVGGGAFYEEDVKISFDKYTTEDQKHSLEDEKGFFSYINMVFGWIMLLCSKLSGGIYLIALFIFAVIMKIILFPFGIKQQKGMVKQAEFRPKEMAIQAKYKGRTDRATVQKMQQEIMEAKQKENISMFGGCLPLLLQLPILLILFNVIMNPLQYICGATTGTIEVLTERAINLGYMAKSTGRDVELVGILRDHFADFEGLDGMVKAGINSISDLPNFTIGSFDLAQKPVLGLSVTVLIPVLTFIVAYYSSKLTRKMSYQAPTAPGSADAATSMKIMDLVMPLFSAWISFMYPAVIGCYWIFQNVLSTVQQWILKKMYPYPEFTEEDYKKAEKELMGKVSKRPKPGSNYDPNKPKVRSLHHIDDEDDDLPPAPTTPNRYDDDDDDTPAGNSSIGRADLK